MDTIKLLERRINLLEKRLDSLLNHEDDATKLEWLTTTELGKQVNRDGRTILKWINKGKFSPDLLKKIHHGNKRFIYRLKSPEAVEKAKKYFDGTLIMGNINWKAYGHRLQPFDGHLIPVFENGKRISGAVKDHNFTVKDILAFNNVRAIELRTSKELMCIDFDSLEAIRFAETEGEFILEDLQTWLVQRDNQPFRCKFFLYRTNSQQEELGEFSLDLEDHDLEVFSKSTKPVTVLGWHRESGLYRWYGTDPSKINSCPPKIWDFIVDQYQKKYQKIKSNKSSSRDWRPIRPCPICNRTKDKDCLINRDRNFIQCHQGKTNNPPFLKVGETIKRQGQEWAFCGLGTNAIGEFSKFKIHISTPTPWDIIYGDRK